MRTLCTICDQHGRAVWATAQRIHPYYRCFSFCRECAEEYDRVHLGGQAPPAVLRPQIEEYQMTIACTCNHGTVHLTMASVLYQDAVRPHDGVCPHCGRRWNVHFTFVCREKTADLPPSAHERSTP